MKRERSQPPAMAMWLSKHIFPKEDREVICGDLLERFGEGQSDGWFWRQVLIAILLGFSRELRKHWTQICFATLGTPLLWLSWGWFGRTPLERVWFSVSLPWPASAVVDLCLRAAFGALMSLPILVIVLYCDRALRWLSIARTFLIISIAFPLIVAEPWSLWISPPGRSHLFFAAAFTFLGLLTSAWLGCSLPARSINSSGEARGCAQ